MKGIRHLKNLIEINNDRTLGFRKALEDLEPVNADLKLIFTESAAQSEHFAQELTILAEQHGTEVDEDDESVAGAIHRAWIDVKALFGGKDRKSILEEAERGEDAIKAAYKKVMDSGDLTGQALETVLDQAGQIRVSHDRIKALRDSAS
ncbi:ferritin-like domain-containing protein [Sphingobacterium haloxyli]|uniref:Aldehyde dehydrogenase n=1 Tax=Sphingobacterium haloxyli TaxID=2100533 RepID=A0A2S9J144_9SPHI|nr:PA2169 family four-helix-bundle protein [Sphingobacterium haloxyli]PRD46488.1 aldehyde dehydrogenase [Sphingobacterium haloxyli]